MSLEKLFEPMRLGHHDLKHRVIMAPLTRFRADENGVPNPKAKTYYEQRAVEPGTLIITEATFISPRAGGYDYVPGIWSHDQVVAWKEIVDAIHAKGSFVWLQLWALGRTAKPEVIEKSGFEFHGAGSKPVNEGDQAPKPLTEDEIQSLIHEYEEAAKNATEAGFDGVEVHGANGYLIDQFWQDVTNDRTDKYGGSIENRARFGLEVTKAVIKAAGDSKRVAMRLSPWSTGQRMKMKDPLPQFSYIIEELKKLDLAYLHLIESRKVYNSSAADGGYWEVTRENDRFIEIWGKETPLLLAGGYDEEKTAKVLNDLYPSENIGVAFGRLFISNPDLHFRLKNGIPLTKYDRATFYSQGMEGYLDYAYSTEYIQGQTEKGLLEHL